MKRIKSFVPVSACAGVLSIFMFGGVVMAQTPVAPRPQGEAIRVRKVSDLKNEYKQKTPVFTGNRSQRDRTWGVFDATFDVAPEWIDDMSVTFTVMLLNPKPKAGDKPMTLFQLTASYADVQQGRDRKVGVVLPPAALERFGNPIGFVAQFSVDGNPAGVMASSEGALKNADKWWENPAVIDHQNVAKRSGYLLERSKSVFGLVEIDNYEAGR